MVCAVISNEWIKTGLFNRRLEYFSDSLRHPDITEDRKDSSAVRKRTQIAGTYGMRFDEHGGREDHD
jgi:hypothetical protein